MASKRTGEEPVAKDILLAGKVLKGEDCLRVGLSTELVSSEQLLAAADALAGRIAAKDSLAVRISKMVFHAPRGSHSMIDSLAQSVLFESPSKFDRMQAFLERNKK